MSKPTTIKPIRLRQKFLNMIIYAEPGTGKTPLIGTSKNALILDADNGTESAAIFGTDADAWPVQSHEDLVKAHEFLREEDHGYEWVWLDSVTVFQEVGLADIMAELVALKPHLEQYVPSQREYLINMNRLLDWTRHMQALPINFGLTAHVMTIETENENEETITTFMPAISGRKQGVPISSHICGQMNVVGHLRKKKSKQSGEYHVLTCQRRGAYFGKDRFGVLGEVKKPTIPKIQELVAPVISSKKSTKLKKKPRKKVR